MGLVDRIISRKGLNLDNVLFGLYNPYSNLDLFDKNRLSSFLRTSELKHSQDVNPTDLVKKDTNLVYVAKMDWKLPFLTPILGVAKINPIHNFSIRIEEGRNINLGIPSRYLSSNKADLGIEDLNLDYLAKSVEGQKLILTNRENILMPDKYIARDF